MIRYALCSLALLASDDRDWLIAPGAFPAAILERPHEIELSNGLIRRVWRTAPDAACVAFDNLASGAAILRGIKPEALVVLDGKRYAVGGLLGQPDYAYLLPEWLETMTPDPAAFHLLKVETGKTQERFAWKRVRHSEGRPWPPPGVALTLSFAAPESAPENHRGVAIEVHYELYNGIPLIAKWIVVRNGGSAPVRLDTFTSELLAAVEFESNVELPDTWLTPALYVESDYIFHGFTPRSGNVTTHWVADPQYRTQVNYRRQTPCLLESRPPIGPAIDLAPGEHFESFRTYELVHDSSDRERMGLARRRMYRTLAPWATENPILMHVRHSDPKAVRLAIDQCAAVGFEMVILSFGSGFDMESEDPAYIAQIKALVEYAHSKGVELGGYSLLASRRISDEHDAINPQTGKPGDAIFGNSPCLCSQWGTDYFRKLRRFIERTGLDILEHDGSYPGDVCASTAHPGHRDLQDSQYRQWKRIAEFYHWCRARGVYLNVPDWYFLNGSNKHGMGYRETNWSLPRERQIILGRQNIHDGTWIKAPSMGWMFVPLTQYHGGGAAATLEPLREHLDAYGWHLAQNFGLGVQACYRGPRLFDAPETRALVAHWVDFFKRHRAILESDLIHMRRADGRDIDAMLHVNPALESKGLLMVFNPLDRPVEKTLAVPLYYAGLRGRARFTRSDGEALELALDRRDRAALPVLVAPRAVEWYRIE